MTALSLLGNVNIKPGQHVLINGASGGIGSAALQLAKHYGAKVTAVCGTARVDYVKALGADEVIDYTQEDFTQNGKQYDLIFDVLRKSSLSACKDSLTPQGRYLLASFKTRQLLQMLWTHLFSQKKIICALASEKQEDLRKVKDLAEASVFKTLIDKCFPLEQTVKAHEYYESGKRRGSVIIKPFAN